MNKSMKRTLQGIVVSDKMEKTRVIAITRLKKHPRYLKYYKITKNFKAHDEKNEYKTGDKVLIQETKPMSKDKRWKIIERI
ncbi:30S ribosomal protein S17 [Candidatus Wolfebacteria bacterium RBG_13_41_7]|uniref:Small ribosomal subunit protein uS17 n=1 Tax=Candidatus Wolfebacteria bacterium RBG_13_41_7 TaxID=1802554 RepID=A0A1F8DLX3_9BACT|nr:MAG: 30S ribosomal protein S17 [Candidatus Wolfebacteria bacterium RBG_13_41_7]